MTQCSSCGASVRSDRKFCGVCGTTLRVQAPQLLRCRYCGFEAAGTAKFCRSCGKAVDGASVDGSVRQASENGRLVWVGIAVGLTACVLLLGGYFVLRTPATAAAPAESDVARLVAQHVPSIAELQSVQLQSLEPYSSGGVDGYRATFAASAVVRSTLYDEAGVEDQFVLLKEAAAEGATVALTGAAFLKAGDAGAWTGEVSLAPSLLDTAMPRNAFAGQTIVDGSVEHLAVRQARVDEANEAARAREAAQQAADRRLRDEQLAREQAAEEARAAKARLAAQQAQAAAAAEAARLEAERQARLDQQAEARRQEEAARREAEIRREQETRLGSGRVPRGKEVTVRLQTALRSDAVAVEDRFIVTTVEDIVVDRRVLVPAGATLRGAVAEVQSAGRANRTARLDLRFDLLSVGSRSFPIRGRAEMKGSGLKGDAKKVGIGAGIGAVVGGILGGAKGAAIGAGAGGGGTLAVTEGQEIDLPAGAQFKVKFDSAVDLP